MIKKVTKGWVIGLNSILGALKLNENEFNEQNVYRCYFKYIFISRL